MKYPLFKVHVDAPSALKELETVLTSGFINEGEQVTKLTQYLVDYFNHSQTVVLNSCTYIVNIFLKTKIFFQ